MVNGVASHFERAMRAQKYVIQVEKFSIDVREDFFLKIFPPVPKVKKDGMKHAKTSLIAFLYNPKTSSYRRPLAFVCLSPFLLSNFWCWIRHILNFPSILYWCRADFFKMRWEQICIALSLSGVWCEYSKYFLVYQNRSKTQQQSEHYWRYRGARFSSIKKLNFTSAVCRNVLKVTFNELCKIVELLPLFQPPNSFLLRIKSFIKVLIY